MSEILTIDTGSGVVTEQRLDPLPLFSDKHPMLSVPIPEYKEAIPNPTIKNLVTRLKMTMKLYGGVGLAANQCGVFERVFVIGTEHFQIACINPKVVAQSEELTRDNEGCLSFPALYVKVERPVWCDVEFYDETGAFKQIRLEGLTARCFLHELDHLNGVKFTSYVGAASIQQATRKQAKLIKKIVRRKK